MLDWYESLDFIRFHSYWHIYLKGDNALALSFIAKARKIVKPKSVEWYQLEDLELW